MADYKSVEHIEGPYWSYSDRMEFLHGRRYAIASNAAEYLLSGDLEWALRFAKKYEEFTAALDRCSVRYNMVKDLDSKWIGWRTQW